MTKYGLLSKEKLEKIRYNIGREMEYLKVDKHVKLDLLTHIDTLTQAAIELRGILSPMADHIETVGGGFPDSHPIKANWLPTAKEALINTAWLEEEV